MSFLRARKKMRLAFTRIFFLIVGGYFAIYILIDQQNIANNRVNRAIVLASSCFKFMFRSINLLYFWLILFGLAGLVSFRILMKRIDQVTVNHQRLDAILEPTRDEMNDAIRLLNEQRLAVSAINPKSLSEMSAMTELLDQHLTRFANLEQKVKVTAFTTLHNQLGCMNESLDAKLNSMSEQVELRFELVAANIEASIEELKNAFLVLNNLC